MADYVSRLNGIFQVDAAITTRTGYGKCLNVNQRTLISLCGPPTSSSTRCCCSPA